MTDARPLDIYHQGCFGSDHQVQTSRVMFEYATDYRHDSISSDVHYLPTSGMIEVGLGALTVGDCHWSNEKILRIQGGHLAGGGRR